MKMSFFVSFVVLCLAVFAQQTNSQECLANIQDACRPNVNKQTSNVESKCNARYGAIDHLEPDLVNFATSHIIRSFEYLLMSTHFGNYDMNREGFEKLFRGFSDTKWSRGIDLIKHITKRGGKMNFQAPQIPTAESKNYELHEIESLAKALDIEKSIMADANLIHERAIRKLPGSHDAEISHYIEEEFVEKEAEAIRDLTGHITELSQMLEESSDNALSLYLFDGYLKGL